MEEKGLGERAKEKHSAQKRRRREGTGSVGPGHGLP
jgi:hypothetical protein